MQIVLGDGGRSKHIHLELGSSCSHMTSAPKDDAFNFSITHAHVCRAGIPNDKTKWAILEELFGFGGLQSFSHLSCHYEIIQLLSVKKFFPRGRISKEDLRRVNSGSIRRYSKIGNSIRVEDSQCVRRHSSQKPVELLNFILETGRERPPVIRAFKTLPIWIIGCSYMLPYHAPTSPCSSPRHSPVSPSHPSPPRPFVVLPLLTRSRLSFLPVILPTLTLSPLFSVLLPKTLTPNQTHALTVRGPASGLPSRTDHHRSHDYIHRRDAFTPSPVRQGQTAPLLTVNILLLLSAVLSLLAREPVDTIMAFSHKRGKLHSLLFSKEISELNYSTTLDY